MKMRPRVALAMFVALSLVACSPLPTDRPPVSTAQTSFRPLALGGAHAGTVLWDEAAERTYLAVPARRAVPTKPSAREGAFSRGNWSYSVKQKERVQVYIVQTPDWFEVVEQELPRHQQVFNRVEEAIAYANERYAGWSLVSLEP